MQLDYYKDGERGDKKITYIKEYEFAIPYLRVRKLPQLLLQGIEERNSCGTYETLLAFFEQPAGID